MRRKGRALTMTAMPIKHYKRVFRALANETRLRILLALLPGKAKHVTQIATELELKQSTVSHNLKRLLDCGLIAVRQRGHFHFYSANKPAVGPLFRLVAVPEEFEQAEAGEAPSLLPGTAMS